MEERLPTTQRGRQAGGSTASRSASHGGELWKRVDQLGKRGPEMAGGKKGFGCGPGDTSVEELLSEGKYTEAVLDFVRKTKVDEAKNGIIRPRH